jgi:hypothetical protein
MSADVRYKPRGPISSEEAYRAAENISNAFKEVSGLHVLPSMIIALVQRHWRVIGPAAHVIHEAPDFDPQVRLTPGEPKPQ